MLFEHLLSNFTSWRVGGPGEALLIPKSIDDLISGLSFAKNRHMPVTWLGLGSNVLIDDEGLRGLVIITQGSFLSQIKKTSDVMLYVEAGVPCGQLARFSARQGLQGLEFLAGIPGTVGGALRMNAGCYGGETWDYVTQVETITIDGERHIRAKNEFSIGYRSADLCGKEYFLGAYFQLQAGNKEVSLSKIKTLLERRNQAQPTNLPNCGSVFKNPPGQYAGQLIEACGLKGYRIGGAQISEKHANFIVNIDHASSSDIRALIQLAKEKVKEQFGVLLEQEVQVLAKNVS